MEQLLEKLQVEPLLNKALKGAALGAGIGLCLWVGKQAFPATTTPSFFNELTADANQALASDPEIRVLCQRLQPFGRLHDKEAYATLLLAWTRIINLNTQLLRREIKPKMSHPRLVATYCSHVVEAIRTIRATLVARNAPFADFDDIAADFQRLCNQYSHNITKTVEFQLIQ